MMIAQTGKKKKNEKSELPIGLVQVLIGQNNFLELGTTFGAQFPWGGEWKVKDYGDRAFLAKFPNASRLQDMIEYPRLGLKGLR